MKLQSLIGTVILSGVLTLAGLGAANAIDTRVNGTAQQTTKPGSMSHPAGTPPLHLQVNTTTSVNLTTEECTTLGGSLHVAAVCNSGHSCERADENGNWHAVCISQIKAQ